MQLSFISIVFLTGHLGYGFVLQGTFEQMSWDIFDCHKVESRGVGCSWHLVSRGQECCKHPTRPRTSPQHTHNKEFSGPNVSISKAYVERERVRPSEKTHRYKLWV